jgi:hypothetical protein
MFRGIVGGGRFSVFQVPHVPHVCQLSCVSPSRKNLDGSSCTTPCVTPSPAFLKPCSSKFLRSEVRRTVYYRTHELNIQCGRCDYKMFFNQYAHTPPMRCPGTCRCEKPAWLWIGSFASRPDYFVLTVRSEFMIDYNRRPQNLMPLQGFFPNENDNKPFW